jgi:hypothetical protein
MLFNKKDCKMKERYGRKRVSNENWGINKSYLECVTALREYWMEARRLSGVPFALSRGDYRDPYERSFNHWFVNNYPEMRDKAAFILSFDEYTRHMAFTSFDESMADGKEHYIRTGKSGGYFWRE